MKKLYILVGTRPNFMKITRFKELAPAYGVDVSIIHTGQHYDQNMANVFFDQFELRPDFFLEAGGMTPTAQIAEIMLRLEQLIEREGRPDYFMVPGDVNSTMAGAIVANKMNIPLIHLESGLRSFDPSMPEEHNRIVTDRLSNICLVTEPSGLNNLRNEGNTAAVHWVGNTMIDTLVKFGPQIAQSSILADLNVGPSEFILCTFHRPSNVDGKDRLIELVDLINALAECKKVVLPLHPRTRKKLEDFGLHSGLDNGQVIITEPLGYFEFQHLIGAASVVITDSGGIQEETTFRQVPCLTLRENTERPITIVEGTNTLVSFDIDRIVALVKQIQAGDYKKGKIPKFWDGHATERILELL